MAKKDIRLLIVTNSIPLPASDFLRDKVVGLSGMFDLHLLCWDTRRNKNAFLQQQTAMKSGNIHLYPKLKGLLSQLWALLVYSLYFLLYPNSSLRLLRMIVANNSGLRNIIHEFVLYAPLIRIRPDLIHFEFGSLAAAFKDIKDYFPVKASSSFRGYDLNYVALDNPEYYTKVWRSFDGYHFLGKDLRERAIRRGYKHGKLEALISPAIDTTLFQPLKSKDAAIDKLIIVSTGRLVWKKGYEYGIRAVAQLKSKGIPFEYRIIGDGEHMQAIQFTIFELGLENEVVLLGRKNKNEIQQLLSQADVFLHPAVSEGFCNAVLEAQAMGVPVVTTDADGLSENVIDGLTGFVVPKWDAAGLAGKLEWCATHPVEAKAMGENGIARVKEQFRLEDQIRKFEDFYGKLYLGTNCQ